MKATVRVSQLQELLDLVSRFVSRHATLPILENVLIKAWVDTITLKATDMEKYIEVEMPAQVESDGALTINAKTLTDIIKATDDEQVLLHADLTKDSLKITTSNDNFTIKWISASEYVAVPTVQSDTSVVLQTRAFSYWISKVEYAVTEKNFSPVLTWVYIRTKDTSEWKKLVFVGTDSFRLGEYSIDFAWTSQDFSLIIPKIHINDIKRVADYSLSKENDTMTLQYSDNMIHVSFQAWDVTLHCTTLLIQWTFPDYENENIMPTTFNAKVRIESTVLDKAIKKIGILTRDINNFISIQLEDDAIAISSWDTDMWKWATRLPCLVEWEMTWFGMNWKYVSDFLRSAQWDEVVMNVVDNQKPVIFKDIDDEQFTYIVRPLIK